MPDKNRTFLKILLLLLLFFVRFHNFTSFALELHIENAPGLAPCIKAVARLQSAAIDTRKNNRRYKQKTLICTVIGISEFFFAFSTLIIQALQRFFNRASVS
ncbi:hypothetical protein [Phascolarctobacterium sp.]